MIYLTHNVNWSILGFDEEHFEWRGSFVKDELITDLYDNYYFPSLTTKDPYIYAFSPEKQTLIEIDKLTKNITRSLNIGFGSSSYNKCFVRNDDNYIYIYLDSNDTYEGRLYKIDISSFSVVSYVNVDMYASLMVVDSSYIYLVFGGSVYRIDKNTLSGSYYSLGFYTIGSIGVDTSYVYLGGSYWNWEIEITCSVVRKYDKNFASYTEYIYDNTGSVYYTITGLAIDDNYVYCISRVRGKVHKIDKTSMTKVAESTLTITDTDCWLFTLGNENILVFKLSDPPVVYKDIFTTPIHSIPENYKPMPSYIFMADNKRFQRLIPDGSNLYTDLATTYIPNTVLFRIDTTNRTIKAQSPVYPRGYSNEAYRPDFICWDDNYVYWAFFHKPGGSSDIGYGKVLKLNKTTLEEVGSITIDQIRNMVSNTTNLFVFEGTTTSQIYSINKSSFTIQASTSISYFADMITEGEYLKVIRGSYGNTTTYLTTYDNNLNVISDEVIKDRAGNNFNFKILQIFESKRGYYYIRDYNSTTNRWRMIQLQGAVVQRIIDNPQYGQFWVDDIYVYCFGYSSGAILQRWREDYNQYGNPVYVLEEEIGNVGIGPIIDQFIFDTGGNNYTIKFQKIPLQILATDNKTTYGVNLNSKIYRTRYSADSIICYLSKDDLSIQDQWPIPSGLVDLPQNYIPGGYTPPGGGSGGGGGGGGSTGERVYGYIY